MDTLKACFKFLLFTLLCVIVIPTQLLVLLVHKGRYSYIIPHYWHKGVCLIFGIRYEIVGKPYTDSQVLYMSNHISYLDIPLLASIIRTASFVAKKDVASWPVFGFLSKLQQTAFISRSREDAKKEANALDTMLEDGKNLTIFPEGTSTDGREVIPFKSSLFSIALQEKLPNLSIQPLTLQIVSVDGQEPNTQALRDIYSWHRDMDDDLELHHHLWGFAKRSGALIRVTFHDVIKANDFNDRKTLAKTCHEAVCNGLEIQTKAA